VADSLVGIIQEDGFFNLMAKGTKARKALLTFSEVFLTSFQELMESDEETAFLEHPAGKPLLGAMQRISRVCRAIGHCFCGDAPLGVTEFSDKDALYFQQYKGSDLMEKIVAKLFKDGESFWFQETREMIEKGGAVALAGEKLADLKSQLASPPSALTIGSIKQMGDLFKEVQKSARTQKLAALSEKFLATQHELFIYTVVSNSN